MSSFKRAGTLATKFYALRSTPMAIISSSGMIYAYKFTTIVNAGKICRP